MSEELNAGPLSQRVVLVTGAGSGIGRSVALLAGAAGAVVIATDISGHQDVAQAVVDEGGLAEAHDLDVTSRDAWNGVVDSVLAAHGRIDGLVNVAGIVLTPDSLLNQSDEGWDRVMDVDLKGPFLGMQTVVPHMLESGYGRIVNVAAVAGLLGMPHVVAYSAAKGGVMAMTRQVAMEFVTQGIRANSIAPGVIETPILDTVTPALMAEAKAAVPIQELGKPDDIGSLAIYLLGPAGNFVTGQTLVVDGGWTAR